MDVAEPALAALRDERPHAVMVEVGDHFAGGEVADDSADRHAQFQIFPAAAIAVGTHAVLAALGTEDAGVAEIDERVEVAVGDSVNTAASAAIPARRSALRHVFLAPEGGRAIAAIAGNDLDFRFVEEFHVCKKQKSPAATAGLFVAATGLLRRPERCSPSCAFRRP